MGWNNLSSALIARCWGNRASQSTNSPHPRPAKDSFSTGRWELVSSRLSGRCLSIFQPATGMISVLVQRNCVPSLHIRCMMTASRRASATMAFCSPRLLATPIARPSARTISSPASAGSARTRRATIASCRHRITRSRPPGGFRPIHGAPASGQKSARPP